MSAQYSQSLKISTESTALPHGTHILVRHLWAFTTLQLDLTLAEELHVLDCEECRQAFLTCLVFERRHEEVARDGGLSTDIAAPS
jgi:hypothetical protein